MSYLDIELLDRIAGCGPNGVTSPWLWASFRTSNCGWAGGFVAQSCTFRRVNDRAEWERLFSRVDQPHLVQSWAYGEAKEATQGWQTTRRLVDAGGWRPRRLVFERDGQPVAICQLLDKSLAGISWSSRLNRGPLFLGDSDEAVVRDGYAGLRAHWRHLRGILVLAPALSMAPENHRLLSELGFRARGQRGWRSARLDLRLDEDELRRNLSISWRNRLKKAEKSGLTLRITSAAEDLEWIIERHVENMREKHFEGPAPSLLRALHRAAPDDFLMFQGRLGDETAGAMIVYRFGNTAEYYVGWFGPAGRKAGAGNFLYWQVALEMKRRGCRYFDLGGYSADETYGHFKKGMRGTEYVLLNEWLSF